MNNYQRTYDAVTRVLARVVDDPKITEDVRAERRVHVAIVEAMRPAMERDDIATAVYGLAMAMSIIAGSIPEAEGREALLEEFKTIALDRAGGLSKLTSLVNAMSAFAGKELCAGCKDQSCTSGATLN